MVVHPALRFQHPPTQNLNHPGLRCAKTDHLYYGACYCWILRTHACYHGAITNRPTDAGPRRGRPRELRPRAERAEDLSGPATGKQKRVS